MLTEDSKEFCGGKSPYGIYLKLNEMEHQSTKARRRPQTNGFAKRFDRRVPDEFLREAFRKRLHKSVEAAAGLGRVALLRRTATSGHTEANTEPAL